MALIKCPDCGRDVSDKAERCMNCGRPILVNQMISRESFPIPINICSYTYAIGLLILCISPLLPYNKFGYDNMFEISSGIVIRAILFIVLNITCLIAEVLELIKKPDISTLFSGIETIVKMIILIVCTGLFINIEVVNRAISYANSLGMHISDLYPPKKSIGFYLLMVGFIITYCSIMPMIMNNIREMIKNR